MPAKIDDKLANLNSSAPEADDEQTVRQMAIKQIERKRRFWTRTAMTTAGMLFLIAVWAVTEYYNSGGWPTNGFSQSSGTPGEWNIWIVYPFIAWVLFTAGGLWDLYLRKPISETEIEREIERQSR